MGQCEMLQIYALGDLRIQLGGELLRDLRSRKAQALLVYLASNAESHARDVLADMFWSESSQLQAMSNLRDVLSSLRKFLDPYVTITRYSVSLNPEAAVYLDVNELDSACTGLQSEEGDLSEKSAEKLEIALELYQSDFLSGFHIRSARGFDEWLLYERERIRLEALEALFTLVNFHANVGNFKKGIHFARRTIDLEPLMEAGHQQLIRLLDASGRSSEALIQYEKCRELLSIDLGVEPSSETQELYAILIRGERLPCLSSIQHLHNLPLPLPDLIGRDDDLERIAACLEDPACRLLTLIGVGGIGKTRLGFHAAAAEIDFFPEGVWLVELAAFTESDILPDHIASVFGVSAQEAKGGLGVTDILVDYLKQRKLLLVLDNCEHLIEACAWFVDAIIKGCAHVTVLATSREAFGISGEQIYQVLPLAVPPDDAQLQNLDEYPSIQLFCMRAASSRPRFSVTAENIDVLSDICRQLDGIPLAIELAAARVKVLSLNQIAARLLDRFQLLTGGPRTALPQHRTLQATMEWSYHFLSELERSMFRRLPVFSGGWTLEAAEEVVSFGDLTKQHMLDLHTQLVDKSLVSVERRSSFVRYGMLETVRQYGMIKLLEEGEIDEVWRRHASYFVGLAEQADEGLRDQRQIESLELLDAEHDNLRAALGWSIDNGEVDLAMRLVGALGWYWFMRGHWKEARRWLNKALDISKDGDKGYRAKAIIRAGGMELIRGNLAGNTELVEDALVICREECDQEGIAWCLNLLGQDCTWKQEVIGEAVPLLLESVQIFNKLGNTWGEAWSLRYLGQVAELQGDYKCGIRLQKKALAGFEKIKDIWNAAHSLYLLGLTAYRYQDFKLARWSYEECLARCGLVEDRVMEAHAIRGLAELALYRDELTLAESLFREAYEELKKIGDENCAARAAFELAEVVKRGGDFEQARTLLDQSLRYYIKLGIEDRIALVIVRYAALAEAQGDGERAARLLGSADVHLGGGKNLAPTDKVMHEQIVSSTQKLIGDQAYDMWFAEGAALSLQEAMNYALEGNPAD
jgi:predicted ATPase/DNA-binding SARP family transcriptional activator